MINLFSIFKISLNALRVNKMRSALTMLGIVIGVSSVIAMLAVGTGANQRISEQISSMGGNLIIVLPGSATSGGIRMGSGSQLTLTKDDAIAIEKECPSVKNAAAILNGTAQVVSGNQNWATIIYGATPNIFEVRDWIIDSGRVFTEQDIKGALKVAIVGKTVIDNLFGNIDPLGQVIRIKKVPFIIIGTLFPKGQSPTGQDQDDVIYIPLSTAQKKIFGTTKPGGIRVIMVEAKSAESLNSAEFEIKELLRQRHRIANKEVDDFTVRNLTQIMQVAEQSSKIMTILLGAIASVSLLVGGIGIMNIMLVSVTERTKEIGIRLAVGAKTWDIRLQFIIEAITLSLIGGGFGIILGIVVSETISAFVGWSMIITFVSIVLAFGFSGIVGIFFGFYPAYKASLLNPIDALRYE